MMPAASNKTEQKTSPEAGDVSKVYLNILDRKVRNIEKRKSRLDTIKQKAAAGDTLEKEQQATLQHYETVLATLEFTKDLHKTFLTTSQDLEKQQKKQLKREKQERAASDLKRTADILQIQTTLDALGNDSVRQHFKTGKHGAVVLTEDNLTSLDELYKLISPPVAGEEKFADNLGVAAEHLNSLVEGKEKPVAESTYKELLDLLNLIINCGYFERAREAGEEEEEGAEAEAVEETKEAEEQAEEEPCPVEAVPSTETFSEPPAEVMPPASSIPTPAPDMEEPALPHTQVLAPSVAPHETPASSFVAQMPLSASPTLFQAPPPMEAPPSQPTPPKCRPLAEIVSQVEGTFSFLQESELDLDSPHMDPAVVAAQPMMRPPSVPSQQPPQTGMMGVGFAGAAPHVEPSGEGEVGDSLSLSQQNLPSSSVDFGTGQGFVSHAASLSSGVVADAMFQAPVDDAPTPPSAQPQPPLPHAPQHGMMGQNLTSPGESVAQYELPPSIPLPPSQQAQQDPGQLGSQEKKFQLNASATEFQSRSMYSHQMPLNLHPQHPSSQPPHGPNAHPDNRPMPPPSNVNQDFSPPNFAQAAGDFSQGGNYQAGGYQRGGRGGGPGYRGGPRGGRGGNNSGNVAMPNGFNNRPQNGNSRPGNRGGQGGASFQGFPPRADYRPDGFQGYNSNGFGGNPYQKRGASPGYPRGGNNRGAGGMRGGVPRGGPPRGAGGNRGGMNRPGNQ